MGLFKKKKEPVDDRPVRTEAETLARIEGVTTRLEWLAQEIEVQLNKHAQETKFKK